MALLALAAAALAPAGAAAAGAPSLLWKKGENCGSVGKIFTGECGFEVTHGGTDVETVVPRGVAADPNLPGHVYVADQQNHRVDEFTAWGQFVKAWGWGVVDGEGKLETCGPDAAPPTANCMQGLEGSGAGEFGPFSPSGVAVDSAGDVYVVDGENLRVQKFDPEGNFLRMWGKGVNSGTSGDPDLCTNAGPPTDVCGKGGEGTGNGQFSALPAGSYIAAGPGNTIYVGDKERIQEFEPDGTYVKSIPLPGETVQALAVDSTGNPYVASCQGICFGPNGSKPNVRKLDPATGAEVCAMPVKGPRGIATDEDGNVYVIETGGVFGDESKVLQFNSSCAEIGPPFGAGEIETSTGIATGQACLSSGADLYVSNSVFENSFVNAYGSAPDNPGCPPPPNPPEITDQYATSVDLNGAELKATINPRFWADTHYYVRYGIGKCSEGGCTEEQSLAPGSLLSNKVIDSPLSTAGVFLTGLQPHTTYHYRFVAQSSGGGPVFGVGGKVGEDGAEGTFTTPALPAGAETGCPNQAFRTGASAALPDCRAYEMVSPVDKANGSVLELCSNTCTAAAGLDQSSPEGGKITYTSYRAFGDAKSSPSVAVQYIASRGKDGWSTESVSPLPPAASVEKSLSSIESPFNAFSADLCQGWLTYQTEPPLDPLAPSGHPNLYRGDNCGEAGYEALIRTERHNENNPELQGTSADGAHAVFRVPDHLTSEAPDLGSETTEQLYEASAGGPLRLVSVLPDGTPNETSSSAGTAGISVFSNGREHLVDRALSAAGSRVYWTKTKEGSGPGTLYLRINADQAQSEIVAGECTEPAKACTLPVSETAGSGQAQFWTASADGSVAIFSI
ncbi:MAG TPA: hypothetical protein VLK56_09355, partial [Solirubrobacterales bacterium]|nr:hypothetical protein [Solirubrobacterales bacterium]